MRAPIAALAIFVVAACSTAPAAAPPAASDTVDAAADASSAAPEPCPLADAGAHAPTLEAGAPDLTLARAIAARYLAVHPPADLAWDWGEGTLMASFMALYRATGDGALRAYVRTWLDARIAAGYRIGTSDQCPPALSAIALYLDTCDPKYQAVADRVRDFLANDALRTPEGGISHFGSSTLFGPTLWVDSLFMFGEVAIRRGADWGDAASLDLYGDQYRIFASKLQDPGGFFTHAYAWPGAQDPGVFWARGNGWVLLSGADYLHVRKTRGEADDVALASYRKLAAAVVAAQDPASGMFWTVVNRPGETYLETSATALFAAGLARGYEDGYLDASVRPAIQHALAGVRAMIVDDAEGRPVVTGISGPTDVGRFQDYAAVPVERDLTYGVGAVIFALLEGAAIGE